MQPVSPRVRVSLLPHADAVPSPPPLTDLQERTSPAEQPDAEGHPDPLQIHCPSAGAMEKKKEEINK